MSPNLPNLQLFFLDSSSLSQFPDATSGPENLMCYTRYLTNSTFRGFHPIRQCTIGFNTPYLISPFIPSSYASDRIHPQHLPSAFSNKIDLTMTYEYDTANQFLLGDEVVSLPFITRVYRVDLELEWHEVYKGLLEHQVLDRYRDRSDAGPMSRQGFRRMLKRFGVREAEDDPGSMVWYHAGQCVEAYDCGTGLRIFDNWSPSRQVKHFDQNFGVEIQSIPLCGSVA